MAEGGIEPGNVIIRSAAEDLMRRVTEDFVRVMEQI